jgi:hypothetical protein
MKKILSLVLAAVLLLGCSVTFAEGGDDTGIQMIGGSQDDAAGAVNLDDWKESETAEIPDFANITLVSVKFQDKIEVDPWTRFESGAQAEYLRIRMHFLNTKKTAFNFLNVFGDVICNFGEGYQFGGWKRQEWLRNNKEWYVCEKAEDCSDIDPLYEGYFDVMVTLPNYVVESKEPLSVTFTIGQSEFTVNVRK